MIDLNLHFVEMNNDTKPNKQKYNLMDEKSFSWTHKNRMMS